MNSLLFTTQNFSFLSKISNIFSKALLLSIIVSRLQQVDCVCSPCQTMNSLHFEVYMSHFYVFFIIYYLCCLPLISASSIVICRVKLLSILCIFVFFMTINLNFLNFYVLCNKLSMS